MRIGKSRNQPRLRCSAMMNKLPLWAGVMIGLMATAPNGLFANGTWSAVASVDVTTMASTTPVRGYIAVYQQELWDRLRPGDEFQQRLTVRNDELSLVTTSYSFTHVGEPVTELIAHEGGKPAP